MYELPWDRAGSLAQIWIKRFVIRTHSTDLNQKIRYTRSLAPIWIKRFVTLYGLVSTDLNQKIHKSSAEDLNEMVLDTRSKDPFRIKRFEKLSNLRDAVRRFQM